VPEMLCLNHIKVMDNVQEDCYFKILTVYLMYCTLSLTAMVG
jgi:hypothetical protein